MHQKGTHIVHLFSLALRRRDSVVQGAASKSVAPLKEQGKVLVGQGKVFYLLLDLASQGVAQTITRRDAPCIGNAQGAGHKNTFRTASRLLAYFWSTIAALVLSCCLAARAACLLPRSVAFLHAQSYTFTPAYKSNQALKSSYQKHRKVAP
jgi:hypothetical protein